ncbi:MAG TPA: endopeptidase La [candidate division Zixibacteria bacterium]|nr:endopeptidase La [candidate division Zixibacteria bacterium]
MADREALKNKPETDKLADELFILPTKNVVVYPSLIIPLMITDQKYARLIDEALMGGKTLGLFAQKNQETDNVTPEDIYEVGTAGTIIKMLRFPDGSVRFLVQGLSRIKIKKFIKTEPYLVAKVEYIEDKIEKSVEVEALIRNILDLLRKIVSLAPYLSDDLQIPALNTEDPSKLSDLIASNLNISIEQKQELLETFDVKARLQKLTMHLNKEVEVLELSRKIQSEAANELGKAQREYILREQLKAIQKELGETDERMAEIEEFKKKIEDAKMPPEAKEAALKELDRLSKMNPASAEYIVSRTYLDWLVTLPWSVSTVDNLDIKQVKKVLDEDHYDLEKVKERILEYLAVRKLKQDTKSPILCFVGPPGVGKTSLGMSIARALGRKFCRMSLGGVHDEAEIRGHRRTYIGSLPGRIIQGIRRASSNNPIFMLDEVDKIGQDFRGDPASALLEVLDPEQNFSFSDHYLEVPFDLSKVMFITTANVLDPIPAVLRDRMEVIELPGYTDLEKLSIAKKYLIPKEMENHGLKGDNIIFSDEVLKIIINDYTKESGLRNLDREIATVCRKVAKKIASGEAKKVTITPDNLHEHLGAAKYIQELVERTGKIGVVPGLAWTNTGGEILFIEARKMPGKKSLTLTGHLGEVMKESAQTALSYIRSTSQNWGISPDFYEKYDIHVHVPAGAIPKDGPSAGIAIATAIASLLTEKPVKPLLAMTGEITLTGKVLPIGGLKEKSLGAYRAGIKTVILPKNNQKDLEEIPDEIKKKVKFVFVDSIDEVIDIALDMKTKPSKEKAPPKVISHYKPQMEKVSLKKRNHRD